MYCIATCVGTNISPPPQAKAGRVAFTLHLQNLVSAYDNTHYRSTLIQCTEFFLAGKMNNDVEDVDDIDESHSDEELLYEEDEGPPI